MKQKPAAPSTWHVIWRVALPLAALAVALGLIWQISVAAIFGDGVAVSSEMPASVDEHATRLPRSFRDLTNPLPATPEHLAAGAALFGQHCAFCHGLSGLADTPAARGMRPQPVNFTSDKARQMTDTTLFYHITKGEAGSGMPAWEGILTEEQRWQLVLHIRELQRTPSRE